MKALLLLLSFCFCTLAASAQGTVPPSPSPNPNKKILLAEAACGQCKFGLAGKGCNLAVRLNGKSFFVDGTDIDAHGDAHAKDGFCQAIRQAKVQGEVVGNRFEASYFQLMPAQKEKAE